MSPTDARMSRSTLRLPCFFSRIHNPRAAPSLGSLSPVEVVPMRSDVLPELVWLSTPPVVPLVGPRESHAVRGRGTLTITCTEKPSCDCDMEEDKKWPPSTCTASHASTGDGALAETKYTR